LAIVTAGLLPLDVRAVSTAAWSSLTYTTRTASYAAADERSVGAAGTKMEFWGSGLSFNAAGKLVAGKVFAYQESVGGQVTYRVDNLAVSVTTLMSSAKSGTALTSNLSGNDDLRGTAGADWLNGFAGNDSIAGGAGNDTILGGAGDDMINGGTGLDTAALSLGKADYTLVSWRGTVGVAPKTAAARSADGFDELLIRPGRS
jgi:Ca2+-binding RTX toxin-like protein